MNPTVSTPIQITGATQLLGLIGDPVRHSLSPIMQNAALAALGLDFVYVPFPVRADDLMAVLTGFEAIGLRGFNVTIPHKQDILKLVDRVTPIAQSVGAVNTVWRRDNEWWGTNTDVQGFISPLQQPGCLHATSTAVVLGTGGAARAVVVGCQQLGFRTIVVVGRNAEKRRSFGAKWSKESGNLEDSKPLVLPWEELPDYLPLADLVVNTTPVGMEPQVDQSPLSPEWVHCLPTGAIVYDLIYIPHPTQLLRHSQERGLKTIDGLEMLVQQGAAALEIWTQGTVPVAIMRSALQQYLEIEESSAP